MDVIVKDILEECTFAYVFWGVVVFWLGCCFASFLNVCIWRMPLGESVVNVPSHCPKCNHKIRWYENIPLFSFLALRGKCSGCKQPISWRYFIVELSGGLLTLATYLKMTFSDEYFYMIIPYTIIIMISIASAFIDFEHRIIPNQLTYFGILSGIIFYTALTFLLKWGWKFLLFYFVQILVVAGFLFLFHLLGKKLFKQDAFGMGDVKFITAIVALSNIFIGVYALFIASIAGLTAGIIIAKSQKKSIKGMTIPFGPFLAAASIIAILLFKVMQ